jgi:hypothetical protein
VHTPRRLAIGLAATAAVVTLNVPAAHAAGPWCTGTSTVCHSWDSFHANRLNHLRNDIREQDVRDRYRHRNAWRSHSYGPLANLFSWNGWHSWSSWEFWN